MGSFVVGWWRWLVVAAVLILLASLQSFSHPSLHPHTLAALGSTFARAPEKPPVFRLCLLRAKAFCGFFNIKRGKEKERTVCGAGATRRD